MDFRECDKMNKNVKGGSMKKESFIHINITTLEHAKHIYELYENR